MYRYEAWRSMEKILIIDGDSKPPIDGFKYVNYDRRYGRFNFNEAWDLGVSIATNERLIMLDCDRLIPKSLITRALTLKDYEVIYPKWLINMKSDIADVESIESDRVVGDLQKISHRYQDRSGRNAFSGNYAITLNTFNSLPRYNGEEIAFCGFTDLDANQAARLSGVKFVPLESKSIHLHHGYTIASGAFTHINVKNSIAFHKIYELPLPKHISDYMSSQKLDASYFINTSYEEILNGSN